MNPTEKRLADLLTRFVDWSTRIPNIASTKLTNDLAADRDAANEILSELGLIP